VAISRNHIYIPAQHLISLFFRLFFVIKTPYCTLYLFFFFFISGLRVCVSSFLFYLLLSFYVSQCFSATSLFFLHFLPIRFFLSVSICRSFDCSSSLQHRTILSISTPFSLFVLSSSSVVCVCVCVYHHSFFFYVSQCFVTTFLHFAYSSVSVSLSL